MPRRAIARIRSWTAGRRTVIVLLAGIAAGFVGLSLFGTTMIYRKSVV